MTKLLLAAFAALAVVGCAHRQDADQGLRLNDVQVVGSHNSYRIMPSKAELEALEQLRPGLGKGLEYDHPPIPRQLDLGVRQLELDIAADPRGDWRGRSDPPGFKVVHIPGLDEYSHCSTLKKCLADIRAWSLANPRHLPIIITIDAKDSPSSLPGALQPIPFAPELLNDLDRELVDGLGRDRLITPDQVRKGAATLRDAVRAGAWPRLADARGKVLVIFDVPTRLANMYRAGHPNLAGRAMFAPFPAEEAEASVFVFQSAIGAAGDEIRALVRQGYFIRTRSDANTVQARTGDRSMMQAAAASGAQVVSTDYYPGAPDPIGVSFSLTLPDGSLARCNPVRQVAACSLGSERE